MENKNSESEWESEKNLKLSSDLAIEKLLFIFWAHIDFRTIFKLRIWPLPRNDFQIPWKHLNGQSRQIIFHQNIEIHTFTYMTQAKH